MNNQKSRLPLIAVVVVGAVIFVLVNGTGADFGKMFASMTAKKDDHQHNEPQAMSNEEAEANKKMMEQAVSAPKKTATMGAPGSEIAMKNGVPEEPTILVKENKAYKPTPNDSATSAHWYDENSRQKIRTDKMDADRAAGK